MRVIHPKGLLGWRNFLLVALILSISSVSVAERNNKNGDDENIFLDVVNNIRRPVCKCTISQHANRDDIASTFLRLSLFTKTFVYSLGFIKSPGKSNQLCRPSS
jgi:hypothetical protein